ncbi:MAG: GntR family transcriptional regulator [Phycisphaeraceae bacterium]
MITRPPIKQRLVSEQIRREIIEGQFAPGAQLPTRTELERRFAVSTITVQRALDRLAAEGFIHARGRRGTYVAENPPHLSRYGLVFAHHDSEARPWPRFWTALHNEAKRLEQSEPGREVTIFCDADPHGRSAEAQRLMRSVKAHRLAGLVFCFQPNWLSGTPALEESGVPRVAITHDSGLPGVTAIKLDTASLLDRALDVLAEQGRKRVAMVTVGSIYASAADRERFHAGLADRGMSTQPYWYQVLDVNRPQWARECLHLLMNDGQKHRPDGVIIANDNLVEHASAGLIAAGVRVPEDASIVAHGNFPWPTPSVLPVTRLGFDAREVLRVCFDSIDAQRRGEAVEPEAERWVKVKFENELDSADIRAG